MTSNSEDGASEPTMCALERMPHMAKKICLMWCSSELDAFIPTLIMDSRDGARQGLPMDVAAELMFLVGINKAVRAIDLATKTKVNFGEAYRIIDQGDMAPASVTNAWADPLVAKDASKINKVAAKASRPVVRPKKSKGFWSWLFGN